MSKFTAFDKEQIEGLGFEFTENKDGSVNASLYHPDVPANDPIKFDFNGSVEDFMEKFKGEIDRICQDGYTKDVLADMEITSDGTPEEYEANKESIQALRNDMCDTLTAMSVGAKGLNELASKFDRVDVTREEGSDRYIASLSINAYGTASGLTLERSFSFDGTGRDFGAEMTAGADSDMSMEYSVNKAVCDYIVGGDGNGVPDVEMLLNTAKELAENYSHSAHIVYDSAHETEYARENDFVLTSGEIERFEENDKFDSNNPIGKRIDNAISGMLEVQTVENGEMILGGYSPAGEDLEFEIQYDGTLDDLANSIKELADGFDPEEHADMWYEGDGAPDLDTLLEDAQDIKDELESIAYNVDREVDAIQREAGKNDFAIMRDMTSHSANEKAQPTKNTKTHNDPEL